MINLEFGKVYHIYNRGVNKCNLFYNNGNYRYFLHLYEKYIDPVSDTFAWALLKNHLETSRDGTPQEYIKDEF